MPQKAQRNKASGKPMLAREMMRTLPVRHRVRVHPRRAPPSLLLRKHRHEDGQPEERGHARGGIPRNARGRPLLRAQARHAALEQRQALLQLAHRSGLRCGLAQRGLGREGRLWRGGGLPVVVGSLAAVQGAGAAGRGAASSREVEGVARTEQRKGERGSALGNVRQAACKKVQAARRRVQIHRRSVGRPRNMPSNRCWTQDDESRGM
jgi:hypothetical protein